jgi:hypothetical protein
MNHEHDETTDGTGESRLQEATSIAVAGGALERCKFHPEIVWDTFGGAEEAYKIGNARFTAGELRNEFDSRRESTDTIRAAIEEAGMEGCPICDNMMRD